MAERVKVIREWLDSLPDDALVGIEEGGLMIQVDVPEDDPEYSYFEIGGCMSEDPIAEQYEEVRANA